jgi:mRNA interferase MazF
MHRTHANDVDTDVSLVTRRCGHLAADNKGTNLPKDSVANVSQLVALDKTVLTERVGKLTRARIELVLAGIDVVLGR